MGLERTAGMAPDSLAERSIVTGPDGVILTSWLNYGLDLIIHRPKPFFTQSPAHNPTGGNLSPDHAFALLQMAAAYDFRLVEEDIFADLIVLTPPPVAAFCLRAANANIFVATVSVFHADGVAPLPLAMRVNVACGADPRFCTFLQDEIRNMTGNGVNDG